MHEQPMFLKVNTWFSWYIIFGVCWESIK